MADKKQWIKPHAIIFPVPFQGHINPSINLALKLASKGCAVTFVHFEHVHYKLTKARNNSQRDNDFFYQARELGFDIRYLTIDDGFALEFDRNLHFNEYWEAILRDFPSRADKFFEKILIESSDDPFLVPFIVADASFSWPATVARKHNLVNVSFWTQTAFMLSLLYQAHGLIEKGHFPCEGDQIEEHVAGIETRRKSYLMQMLTMFESQPSMQKTLIIAAEGVKKADFILLNTMRGLEPETLSSLNGESRSHFAVGPTNFYKNLPTGSIMKSLLSESDCTEWLDSKPPGSVLYVSFGSLVKMSRRVVEEIAHGLLLSGVNFIWVAREGVSGSAESDIWPGGFEDRVGGKGLVVPWCDQVSVLSNRAVGGFLMHCGWNSILESVWCGVPIICYPITFDQPTNRKLVVEDWEIGINLCEDGESVYRDEVSDKIKYMMSGDTSKCFRQRVETVKFVLRDAVESDGSSEKNFDRFMADLKIKLQEKTLVR